MKNYRSNEEFFADFQALIERWCDERRLDVLATVLPAYTSFNGLTDGWGGLYDALRAVRCKGPDAFSEADWDILCDLTHAADVITYRR